MRGAALAVECHYGCCRFFFIGLSMRRGEDESSIKHEENKGVRKLLVD